MSKVDNELREKLSAFQHDIWAHWMEHLFSMSQESSDGEFIISKKYAERWKRQLRTAYENLSEGEKESDREQADKVLALLKEHLK